MMSTAIGKILVVQASGGRFSMSSALLECWVSRVLETMRCEYSQVR